MTIVDIFRRARAAFSVTDKLFRLRSDGERSLNTRLDMVTLEDRVVPVGTPASVIAALAGNGSR